MKKAVLIFCLLVLTSANLLSQRNDFPKLTDPYLGQKPPGMTPKLFAPGIVSTEADEYAFELSSLGNEMLFVRNTSIMLVTRNNDGTWNKPVVAPFSGKFIDDEPCFSPDGNKIYFMSRRPSSHSKYPSNLWMVQKQNDQWMKRKSIYMGLILSIIIFISHCTQQKDFPVLTGAYFGKKPPGIVPEVFEPNIVSTGLDELNSVFSPDGREFYFCVRNFSGPVSIFQMTMENIRKPLNSVMQ
jgi:hypothetical protein